MYLFVQTVFLFGLHKYIAVRFVRLMQTFINFICVRFIDSL